MPITRYKPQQTVMLLQQIRAAMTESVGRTAIAPD